MVTRQPLSRPRSRGTYQRSPSPTADQGIHRTRRWWPRMRHVRARLRSGPAAARAARARQEQTGLHTRLPPPVRAHAGTPTSRRGCAACQGARQPATGASLCVIRPLLSPATSRATWISVSGRSALAAGCVCTQLLRRQLKHMHAFVTLHALSWPSARTDAGESAGASRLLANSEVQFRQHNPPSVSRYDLSAPPVAAWVPRPASSRIAALMNERSRIQTARPDLSPDVCVSDVCVCSCHMCEHNIQKIMAAVKTGTATCSCARAKTASTLATCSSRITHSTPRTCST